MLRKTRIKKIYEKLLGLVDKINDIISEEDVEDRVKEINFHMEMMDFHVFEVEKLIKKNDNN